MPDVQLTFRADIQQTATKGHRYGQTGEDKRRRIKKRVANPVRPGEGTPNQQTIRLDRTVTNQQHHDAADDKSSQHGDQRIQDFAIEFHSIEAPPGA